jgi:hypothetical protein
VCSSIRTRTGYKNKQELQWKQNQLQKPLNHLCFLFFIKIQQKWGDYRLDNYGTRLCFRHSVSDWQNREVSEIGFIRVQTNMLNHHKNSCHNFAYLSFFIFIFLNLNSCCRDTSLNKTIIKQLQKITILLLQKGSILKMICLSSCHWFSLIDRETTQCSFHFR